MSTSSDNREVIQIGTKIYLFPRLPYETDQQYFARRKFLTKALPKTQKKFLEALRFSMVWANVHFLGCSYSPGTTRDLKQLMATFG